MESFEWNWKTKDQSNMFARGWSPDGQPKGVVCLVHGLGEHVGRYEHVGAALTNAGYALLGYDLRGHGRSDGQRGHIPDFQSLMDDIADFLEQASRRYPGKPIFLYGHSLGGNLVLNYGLRVHPRINGVIASSPWLKLPVEPPASKIALAKLMVNIMPGFSQSSGLDASALSRVPSIVEAYKHDPLVHDKISAKLFLSVYTAAEWALEHADEFSLPLLMTHGTADRICAVEGTRQFAQKVSQKMETKYFEGYFHETHNEEENAVVFETIITWLDAHLA